MTHLHLLLHIVTLDIEALVVPWHQFIYSLLVPDGRLDIQPVHDSVLQVLIVCMSVTSKVLLHLQEEVKVRWCQVRTVWRMVESVQKLNNWAGCMRKRSLLSRCPTYLANRNLSVYSARNVFHLSLALYFFFKLFSPTNIQQVTLEMSEEHMWGFLWSALYSCPTFKKVKSVNKFQ